MKYIYQNPFARLALLTMPFAIMIAASAQASVVETMNMKPSPGLSKELEHVREAARAGAVVVEPMPLTEPTQQPARPANNRATMQPAAMQPTPIKQPVTQKPAALQPIPAKEQATVPPAPALPAKQLVTEQKPTVQAVIANPAPPANDLVWHVARGDQLQTILTAWTQRADWTLVWQSEYAYRLQANATFHGDFVGAVKQMLTAMASVAPPLYTQIYTGNKVVVISNVPSH